MLPHTVEISPWYPIKPIPATLVNEIMYFLVNPMFSDRRSDLYVGEESRCATGVQTPEVEDPKPDVRKNLVADQPGKTTNISKLYGTL